MTRAAGTCLVVSAAWRGVRAPPVVCKPVVRGTPAYLYYTFPTEAAAARGARVALLALVHSFGAARQGGGEGAAYTTGLLATGARQPRRAPLLQTASALREDSSALVLPALRAASREPYAALRRRARH